MLSTLLIGILALPLATEDAPPRPGLHEQWLYNTIGRPVMIEVVPPDAGADLSVILMDASGNLHTEPIAATSGLLDLNETLPAVWRLRRAAYLQLMAGDDPVGNALVVQPLLSRMVPVTRDATNPNGIQYTEVVAWRDEFDGTVVSPPEMDGAVDPLETPEDPWLANLPEDGRLLSGLRIYPDQEVIIRTSAGDIRVALRPDQAPNTVWNFLELCAGGFYRGIIFHRVVPMTREGEPFVIQAGDPTPTGSGGPGHWLPLEPSHLRHDFGVISMARDAHPDSAGSQFFFGLSRAGTARLDGHYCAFGMAVEGAETILDIASVELADVAAGRPVNPPVIHQTDVVLAEPRTPGETRNGERPDAVHAAPVAPPARRVPR